jgi:hypothetical protein
MKSWILSSILALAFSAANATSFSADGRDTSYGITAALDELDSARFLEVFGAATDFYWENASRPNSKINCRENRCWIAIRGREDAQRDPTVPRVVQWHFEWRGPFQATTEFLSSQGSDADALFNKMGDRSSSNYEVTSQSAGLCKIERKKIATSDSLAVIFCQKQTCSNATSSHCLFSIATEPDRVSEFPAGFVTELRPAVPLGPSPLTVPPFQIFRSQRPMVEFTTLLGEGQWLSAHSICAKLGSPWRLPTSSELVALAGEAIAKIPEPSFGKKYANYVSVGARNQPVYVNVTNAVAYENLIDQYAAVMCVHQI